MRSLILLVLILFSVTCYAQKRNYKFVNDYIRYIEENTTGYDSLKFKLDYRITKRDRHRNIRSGKINQYLDSLGAGFHVTEKQLGIKWNARRIDKEETFNQFDEFPKADNGFIYVDYFTVSKPIFYGDFVILIDRGGRTCIHQTSSVKVFKWDKVSGELIEVYSDVFRVSGPCFR